jgi:uncharacterized Fe-S cluster protein YjdI/CDGSH-type Zn-finger protein
MSNPVGEPLGPAGAAGAAGEARASEGGAGAPPDPAAPNRAPDLTREYRAPGLRVQWYAGRCIHSANCVRALRQVFDPQRRPWVTPDAAPADAGAAAVLRCPTGALHFVREDEGAPEAPDVPTTLTPIRNGPLYVRGDVEVRGLDGAPLRRDSRVALCRCGLAEHAPFCDNTCRTVGWREPRRDAAGATGGPESAPPSADGSA